MHFKCLKSTTFKCERLPRLCFGAQQRDRHTSPRESEKSLKTSAFCNKHEQIGRAALSQTPATLCATKDQQLLAICRHIFYRHLIFATLLGDSAETLMLNIREIRALSKATAWSIGVLGRRMRGATFTYSSSIT
jgi:hypothetical protein